MPKSSSAMRMPSERSSPKRAALGVGVVEQLGLGDLQREALRRHAGLLAAAARTLGDQVRIAQLGGGQVDVQAQRRVARRGGLPAPRLAAGLLQHVPADRPGSGRPPRPAG